MAFYRVREGIEVGHNDGVNVRTLKAGDIVELPRALAAELAGKFDPCTKDGKSLAHLSADELEIELAAPHEKASLRAQFAARDAAAAKPAVVEAPAPTTNPMVKVVEPEVPAAPAKEADGE